MKAFTPLIIIFLLFIFPFQSVGASSLKLDVTTDKETYQIGDMVSIQGHVLFDSTPVENALIAIMVEWLEGVIVSRTVETDHSGTFSLQFRLPAEDVTGIYQVYASVKYKTEEASINSTFTVSVSTTSSTVGSTVIDNSTTKTFTATSPLATTIVTLTTTEKAEEPTSLIENPTIISGIIIAIALVTIITFFVRRKKEEKNQPVNG